MQQNSVMAKRLFRTAHKPQTAKPSQSPHHPPTTYPDQQTWRRIVFQRDQILRQFIAGIVDNDPEIVTKLAAKYDASEVNYVLQRYQDYTHTSFLTDESAVYRHYRLLFAQFGGSRTFLSKSRFDAAITQEIKRPDQLRRMMMGMSGPDDVFESDRLTHLNYATDITPPNVPPKPANFKAPSPYRYSASLIPLLNLGWRLDKAATAPYLSQPPQWRSMLPELSRMATDPGLVNGWPGEPASWAPYHALTLLGHWQAYEFSADLLSLLDVKNDWLSDRLPLAWALMGPPAADHLWEKLTTRAYSGRKPSIIVAGLLKMAQTHPDEAAATVRRFVALLEASPIKQADLNAYLIYALDQLADKTAVPAIQTAFSENRVNLRIMEPESVKLLRNWFS